MDYNVGMNLGVYESRGRPIRLTRSRASERRLHNRQQAIDALGNVGRLGDEHSSRQPVHQSGQTTVRTDTDDGMNAIALPGYTR